MLSAFHLLQDSVQLVTVLLMLNLLKVLEFALPLVNALKRGLDSAKLYPVRSFSNKKRCKLSIQFLVIDAHGGELL